MMTKEELFAALCREVLYFSTYANLYTRNGTFRFRVHFGYRFHQDPYIWIFHDYELMIREKTSFDFSKCAEYNDYTPEEVRDLLDLVGL